MKDKAAHKLAATLMEKGLVREVRSKAGMPAWRQSEEGRPLSLIITKLGRASIRVGDEEVHLGVIKPHHQLRRAFFDVGQSRCRCLRRRRKLQEILDSRRNSGGSPPPVASELRSPQPR